MTDNVNLNSYEQYFSGRGGNGYQSGFMNRFRQGTKKRTGSNLTTQSELIYGTSSEGTTGASTLNRGKAVVKTLAVPRQSDNIRCITEIVVY